MAEEFYTLSGDVLSETSQWGRKVRVRVFQHTPQSKIVITDTDNYNQEFAKEVEGDIALDVSDFRVKFEVKRYAMFYPNQALITIYNLTSKTENSIVKEGYRVVVDTGYEDNYGRIFDGNILMCTRWKENGTDYVLQILALDGGDFINSGFCSFTYQKGITARSVAEKMVRTSANAPSIAYISPKLDEIEMTKGSAVHGRTKNYFNDLAKTINGTWFVDSGKLYIVSYADDITQLPLGMQAVELSERTGLIGNPKQNQQGVNARALINPRFMPFGFVHIRNDLITQQLVSIGSYSNPASYPYALDPSGLYRIISVIFRGDTRGIEWYADLTTISQSGQIPETLKKTRGTYN